jgi:hypothetical protein
MNYSELHSIFIDYIKPLLFQAYPDSFETDSNQWTFCCSKKSAMEFTTVNEINKGLQGRKQFEVRCSFVCTGTFLLI